MQLRKVCNHPNLFAEPDVTAPFTTVAPLRMLVPALITESFDTDPMTGVRDFDRAGHDTVDLRFLNLCLLHHEMQGVRAAPQTAATKALIIELGSPVGATEVPPAPESIEAGDAALHAPIRALCAQEQRALLCRHAAINEVRTNGGAIYGSALCALLSVFRPQTTRRGLWPEHSSALDTMVVAWTERREQCAETVSVFSVFVEPAMAPPPELVHFGVRPALSERARQRAYPYHSVRTYAYPYLLMPTHTYSCLPIPTHAYPYLRMPIHAKPWCILASTVTWHIRSFCLCMPLATPKSLLLFAIAIVLGCRVAKSSRNLHMCGCLTSGAVVEAYGNGVGIFPRSVQCKCFSSPTGLHV